MAVRHESVTPTARREATGSRSAHVYACILAGGSGTRFWPLSRRRRPKQLLSLLGNETLLERTLARIRPIIPPERTYVFTSELVRNEVRRALPQIPERQIVAEPASRNTAPTLRLAAHEIFRRDPEAVMVVLPSDHIISKPQEFRRVLGAACAWASEPGRSVVVGLKPTRPETGYGYIQRAARAGSVQGVSVYHVQSFTEKPDLPTARRYVASRRYFWNGGMFIWRAQTLLEHFRRYQPAMAAQLERLAGAGGIRNKAAFKRIFPKLEKISIDYAIMEKIPGIYVIPADIGWSDVGSWATVYELSAKDGAGNVRPRASLTLDARGNMIVADKKFAVTVGVRDLVIVETEDALLVAARDRSQDVGKAVQELEKLKRHDLL